MIEKNALILTSINPPNLIMKELAEGAHRSGYDFFIVGDSKSPDDFFIENGHFISIADQLKSGLSFAAACPQNHYARKNIGYLVAMQSGATVIIETDDDNFPRPDFFASRTREQDVRAVTQKGWVNLYKYFTDAFIWPRGFPLDLIKEPISAPYQQLKMEHVDCPIQQGLADENPDVDAVFRLTKPLPQTFNQDRAVAVGSGSWCPFNSQNTTWWKDAFPLLYLPSYCSFRMTDIWRSLIAQRIAWENNWHIMFHSPTVWQERNPHDLMKDFADEIPGYLHNRNIQQVLDSLSLQKGKTHLPDNLRECYKALVSLGLIEASELELLEAWLKDLADIGIA